MAVPNEAEVVVVGGGTAGAVVAARLAEAGADVLVLEAGPDPGPFGDPRWPADLLDAAVLGTSYDWGFSGSGLGFERASVLGGCSAHNGAVQTWGHRADYDGWSLPGWSADELLGLFERSSAQQRVRTYAVEALTPFQAAWHAAGPSAGLPQLARTNGLDETVGIAPESVNIVDDLPVGENLHDQPFSLLRWEGSPDLERAMAAAAAERWTPDEQVMAKAASSADPAVFDLHFMPFSPTEDGERRWCAGVAALLPRSRGRVWLRDRDPAVLPGVGHRFLSDPEGHDVAVLAEGVAMVRELAAVPELARLLGREVDPGPVDVPSHLRANPDNYWHPVGTCAMGPVTDARGRVHGVEGLVVADASLMPVVPRATTHMPTTVIGERIAACLMEDHR